MTHSANPLRGWQANRCEIRNFVRGLTRSECILVEPDGTLCRADTSGWVIRAAADGEHTLISPRNEQNPVTSAASTPEQLPLGKTLPNGLAFGGPHLHCVYPGSLSGITLPSFRSPAAGLSLAHWSY